MFIGFAVLACGGGVRSEGADPTASGGTGATPTRDGSVAQGGTPVVVTGGTDNDGPIVGNAGFGGAYTCPGVSALTGAGFEAFEGVTVIGDEHGGDVHCYSGARTTVVDGKFTLAFPPPRGMYLSVYLDIAEDDTYFITAPTLAAGYQPKDGMALTPADFEMVREVTVQFSELPADYEGRVAHVATCPGNELTDECERYQAVAVSAGKAEVKAKVTYLTKAFWVWFGQSQQAPQSLDPTTSFAPRYASCHPSGYDATSTCFVYGKDLLPFEGAAGAGGAAP